MEEDGLLDEKKVNGKGTSIYFTLRTAKYIW